MKIQWDVGTLLGVSSSYWKGCTVQAAVRLQIFTHIGAGTKRANDVAEQAGTNIRAMQLLLNALSAIGLLHKADELYSNTDFSTEFLIKKSPKYMGSIILHHHHLVDGWAQLDQAVTTGNPVKKRSYGEAVERESFIMGMFNLAISLAPQIAECINLEGKKRLLDLGGGPGTYAIFFCLANPELRATIFDRPTTQPFAMETVQKFNLEERFSFIGGDFNTDPISGGPYDVAWLSHILHSNSEQQCREIIKKTVAQLSSGGLLLIHDFILTNSKDEPEFAALFSLNMLLNNGVGRSYSIAEIQDMMTGAGVSQIEHRQFDSPNGSSILVGVV